MNGLGGYCRISWARSEGAYRIGLGRCLLVLLLCSPVFANDTNPYSAPVYDDQAHKRDSCAVLGLTVDLKQIDQHFSGVLTKIQQLNSSKTKLQVETQEYLKKNQKNKTMLTLIHAPEEGGVHPSDVRNILRKDLGDLETDLQRVYRRPWGDFTGGKLVVCGAVTCFRLVQFGLGALVASELVRYFLIPDPLLRDAGPFLQKIVAGSLVLGVLAAASDVAGVTGDSDLRRLNRM